MESAFENAGQTVGIQVWRIQNCKPAVCQKNDYGKFYTGDSYIILQTRENNGGLHWDIHIWLGRETSSDQAGCAKILADTLDDQLGGRTVQHLEVQEHESPLFLSNFQSGVRYLAGDVNLHATHVDSNIIEKKLFHVKGKKNVKVTQVDLTVASMNKSDCFILDAVNDIYIYVGPKSKHSERIKAITSASLIRDQDHGGRSKILILDECSIAREVQVFFSVLGNGLAKYMPDESPEEADEEFLCAHVKAVRLYRVSESSGQLQIKQISHHTLLQRMLDSNGCFILEVSYADIYVWIGKNCNKKEKDEALLKAQEFLKVSKCPNWTHLERVVENGESSAFIQYFQGWQYEGELHCVDSRSTGEQLALLEEKSDGEFPDFMPDDASGTMDIYVVEESVLSCVPRNNYGTFSGGESYIIKYIMRDKRCIIYIWQGEGSSVRSKDTAILHARQLQYGLITKSTIIIVVQNYEPKHFLHIFKGKLMFLLGCYNPGFVDFEESELYEEGDPKLFRIRGTDYDNIRASQFKALATNLQSDDVFIVDNRYSVWIWFGKDSYDMERDFARDFAERSFLGIDPTVVKEGEEPIQFWNLLSGRDDYPEHFRLTKPIVNETALFHAYFTKRNQVRFEKLLKFKQQDLESDDIMILDNTHAIFVWVGKYTQNNEALTVLSHLPELLKRYNRQHSVTIVVDEGNESELFTSAFPSWVKNPIKPTYNDMKEQLKTQI